VGGSESCFLGARRYASFSAPHRWRWRLGRSHHRRNRHLPYRRRRHVTPVISDDSRRLHCPATNLSETCASGQHLQRGRVLKMPPEDVIQSFLESYGQSDSAAAAGSIPHPPPACCCGNEHCAYLQHNQRALDGLERDVRTAAKLGQVCGHGCVCMCLITAPWRHV
jgi:hypothetical protein